MPTSNSDDNRDPGQGTDDPLPNRDDANVAQLGLTNEHYVPRHGDRLEDSGLIPGFLFLFSLVIPFLIVLFIWIIVLVTEVRFWNWPVYGPPVVFLWALTSIINWSPLIAAFSILRYGANPPLKRLAFATVIVSGACLFGILSWGYCALVSPERVGTWYDTTFGQYMQIWATGPVPQSFRGCDARVEAKQASLFETDIYYTQFARTLTKDPNPIDTIKGRNLYLAFYQTFDMERFRSIQVNQTLCGQGFEGNDGLYGLGIRISLYLQWLSSFLANNFLPGTRQELQKAYLIFSMAICLATIITSFAKACVFSIEIEIMYWMYWGGYACIFASAPCPVRLGSEIKWIKLDWTTAILFITHVLMIYHGAWFVFYAYDQVFSRMPCGTYHFFLFPILDPSRGFWTLRDYLIHLLLPLIPTLLSTFPLSGLLLASEVKYIIQHSATYQILFPKPTVSDRDQPQTTDYNASAQTSLGLRVYLFIKREYRVFREMVRLPSHSRGGIRLVTPIDVKDRRLYRIRWAAMGLLSYTLSIVAIEVILKWNKVGSIYSIASTGQYVALIIGVGSFVSVLWTLILQETERRRNLKRRQVANQDENGIELDSLSHNLADAVSHAFSRPDIGFSTMDGAFPITSGEQEEDDAQSSNTPGPSPVFDGPNNEAFMSRPLDIHPDLEAQTQPTS